MKTPREFLLKRHRSVEPKLDQMWDKSLAPTVAAAYDLRDSKHNLLFTTVWTLWRELIQPNRESGGVGECVDFDIRTKSCNPR